MADPIKINVTSFKKLGRPEDSMKKDTKKGNTKPQRKKRTNISVH